ncbi:hypothetical protein B4N89_46210 [Embleya scabrispora]|uniref:Uncharacterized protein n=1 Tax=Embleya scabrispora TaxID=159449 RepID=A0A1T3NJ57_9ACTN|nr:hypothetical protein [Embleya scabrispora]OPC76869.1 hypothetical protein B4N89_46210 [Embleya scabrispora]
MDESDPEWADALEWAERIAAGGSPRERSTLTTGAFDALGASGQWRLAYLLLVRVARACPPALFDVRGGPSLRLLVPASERPTTLDTVSLGVAAPAHPAGVPDVPRRLRPHGLVRLLRALGRRSAPAPLAHAAGGRGRTGPGSGAERATRRHGGAPRADVAHLLGAGRREDGAQILTQVVWDRLTDGRRDPEAAERQVASVMGLLGEDHALVGAIRDLCVTALDTIDRARAERDANAVPAGERADAVTARVAGEFHATHLTVSGVWAEDVHGRHLAITRLTLTFRDGLLDTIETANEDGAVHLKDTLLVDSPTAWPEWLRVVVGRFLRNEVCPDCEHLATAGIASTHHHDCPTRN